MGFQRKFHIKSMFLGQNNYIFGRFGGSMGTINTSTKSLGLRMRETTFCSELEQRFLKLKLKLKLRSDDDFLYLI
jgi:hypothetical protein